MQFLPSPCSVSLSRALAVALLVLCSGFSRGSHADDAAPTGASLFQARCAVCHGEKGEGTSDYPDPLIGDRSVRELTRLIDETMPEGEPEAVTGEDAELVAQHIYDSFYSLIAQERNRPARIELSRLTVRQYEQTIADLLGGERHARLSDGEPGLNATYTDGRKRRRRDAHSFERVDPQIDFHFGDQKPEGLETPEEPEDSEDKEEDKDKKDEEPLAYSIRWEGSVIPRASGDYEFVIESENGFRLWVNDRDTPLIDNRVKSGDETTFRQHVRLLAGRPYPLRLEFKRFREPTSSIQLKWVPPQGVEEVIPARNLSTIRSRPSLIITTPFPPDDRSIGYERGTAISAEWEEATTYAALEVTEATISRLDDLAGTKPGDAERIDKLKRFCKQFVTRAFRRPLSDEEHRFFIEQQFEEAEKPENAVKRVVLLSLKSPRFLYREVGTGPFDSYAVASWLSYSLWDSLPDEPLLQAAANNQLQFKEQIAAQAERMIEDSRCRAKLRDFFHQWLHVDRFPELVKDDALFPEFDEQVVADLRVSLDLFLDDVLSSPQSDFRELLKSQALYVNGRLAAEYGVDLPPDAQFQRVNVDQQQRAGVLTHPLLMAGFAYDETTSPIHRGVFLARGVLGRRLKPPPVAVSPLAPDLHKDLSTRERVQLQTGAGTCQSCHAMINPLGFSLEHFDAVGRYRELEADREINAQGRYLDRSGNEVEFTGSRELAEFLASSPEVHEAFVDQLFKNLIKQPIRALGPDQLDRFRSEFESEEFCIKKLIVNIVTESALKVQELESKAPSPAAIP